MQFVLRLKNTAIRRGAAHHLTPMVAVIADKYKPIKRVQLGVRRKQARESRRAPLELALLFGYHKSECHWVRQDPNITTIRKMEPDQFDEPLKKHQVIK
jgi:hypothetical protein